MRRVDWTWLVVMPLVVLLTVAAGGAELSLERVLGGGPEDGFARADRVRTFAFPADHGPHESFRSEWWYVTASLENSEGEAFGVQFTVFRQALGGAPGASSRGPQGAWAADQIYLAHLAITDVAGGRHIGAERLARGLLPLAGARADPFMVTVDGWTLADADADADADTDTDFGTGFRELELDAATDDIGVRLALTPVRPVVLQGDGGLSQKGPASASYYYSLSRLQVTGELLIDGIRHTVRGLAWLDREWSTSMLASSQAGWDWFGLHLEDGSDLMVFQLRRVDGVRDRFDQGRLVLPDGREVALAADAFELRPIGTWQDEQGASWPLEWELVVRAPTGDAQVREVTYRIKPAVDDQRMDTLLIYWEGLVYVFDTEGRRVGSGYMELTGYGG